MYKISYFTEQDKQSIVAFMKAHPFITLTGNSNNHSVATQVPVLIREENGRLTLRGHIMRHTDHFSAFEQNPQVLALFTGPHCYVSAGWYTERGTGSTWNYMTVHARGAINFLGAKETLEILTELTHHYEDGQRQPELVENMTDKYLDMHIKAIAGFEIQVEDIYPLFKLSQNRDDSSYKNIVSELLATGNAAEKEVAAEMMKRRPELF